ncbi:hypothetical protein MBLNU457_7192t1 [Dothideomycetes sp. NU457]
MASNQLSVAEMKEMILSNSHFLYPASVHGDRFSIVMYNKWKEHLQQWEYQAFVIKEEPGGAFRILLRANRFETAFQAIEDLFDMAGQYVADTCLPGPKKARTDANGRMYESEAMRGE